MKKILGFTLVETLIVVLIVGILLSITLSLSFNYVDTMRVKTDKEQLANIISDALAVARTSNYYSLTLFETLTIQVNSLGASSEVRGGNFVTPSTLESFTLRNSRIDLGTGVSAISLDVIPYSIGCEAFIDGVGITGSVSFAIASTINTDRYCYTIAEDVCKLNQIVCEE